jgi:hypothetical protein
VLGEGSGEASCNGGHYGKDDDLEICVVTRRLDTKVILGLMDRMRLVFGQRLGYTGIGDN